MINLIINGGRKEVMEYEQEVIDFIIDYPKPVHLLKMSGDGRFIVTIHEGDKWINVWDVEYQTLFCQFKNETSDFEDIYYREWDNIYDDSMIFSRDSKYLIVGFDVGMVKVFNIEHKVEQYCYDFFKVERKDINMWGVYDIPHTYLETSEDGNYFAISCSCAIDPQSGDGDISTWEIYPEPIRTVFVIDLRTGDIILNHTFPEGRIASIAFSFDEQYFAAAISSGELVLWDLYNKKTIYRDEKFSWCNFTDTIIRKRIAFDTSSRQMFYTAFKSIKVLDILTLESREFGSTEDPLPDVLLSISSEFGVLLGASQFYENLFIWDISSEEMVCVGPPLQYEPRKIQISEEIVVVIYASLIEIYDLSTLEQISIIEGKIPENCFGYFPKDVSRDCSKIAAFKKDQENTESGIKIIINKIK